MYVRHMESGYQSRHTATLSLYQRLWAKFGKSLPDADFTIDFGDGPRKIEEEDIGVWAY